MSDVDLQAWLAEVDDHLTKVVASVDGAGMTHADFPHLYWDLWHESGMEPEEAAEEALEIDGIERKMWPGWEDVNREAQPS